MNVPVVASENTEIKLTRLARQIFKTAVQERFDPRGRPYYWIDGELICCDEDGTDVQTIYQDKLVSLTPLTLDSTARIDLMEMEGRF